MSFIADILFSQHDLDGDDKLDHAELYSLMLALNHGDPVSDWAVDFVLATADVEDDGLVARDEINHALAMWRVLVRQQDAMEELFDGYDADHSGKLNRNGIKGILTKLNDDIPGKSTVQHGSAWISYHI